MKSAKGGENEPARVVRQAKQRESVGSKDLKRYLKDKRIKLDCGHYYCLHPWSNTLIITAYGKTLCHNCYL
jgi:hypothetical protein